MNVPRKSEFGCKEGNGGGNSLEIKRLRCFLIELYCSYRNWSCKNAVKETVVMAIIQHVGDNAHYVW